MAHPFIVAPVLSGKTYRVAAPVRRESAPLPQPPQSYADLEGLDFGSGSSEDSKNSSPTSTDMDSAGRNSSIAGNRAPRSFSTANIRTRSLGYGAGIIFERDGGFEPTDNDVIIVTVRLSNKFRKQSIDGADDLPSRPQRRSFLRRLSTRVATSFDHSAEKEERYKAIKMPRADYRRHFQRDKDGNYAGTEPEREWDEADLMREYEAYQDLPLHTVLC